MKVCPTAAVTPRPAAYRWHTTVMAILVVLCWCTIPLAHAQFNLAGTARKFTSANSDFSSGVSVTSADTTAGEWASSTLDSTYLKPVFVSSSPAPTTVSQANFNTYWQTPFATMVSNPEYTLPYSIFMAQISSTQYRYTAIPFEPFGANVGLFTYEASGVFTYSTTTGGTLQFQSSGDMWVYIGQWDTIPKLVVSLRGIHPIQTGSIDLSTLGLSNGQVQIRVFYAHRSAGITPALQITVLTRPSAYCNALVSSSPVANVYPFNAPSATPEAKSAPAAALSDPNTLQLTTTTTSDPSFGSAVSVYNQNKQRVTSGFTTTFTYQITNAASAGAEGLTFIAQCGSDGLNARGGGSGQLGYNGLPKGLVIEIDSYKDVSASGDAYSNQIGIFYSGASGVLNYAAPLAASGSLASLLGKHDVRIDYYPNIGTSGAGLVRVWLDSVLVVSSDLDASFTTMCNPAGLMYVGFTSSTTSTVYGNTYISNWRFNAVPTAASASTPVGVGFQTQTASNTQSTTRQLYIQAADVCGNAASGIGGATILAQLWNTAGTTQYTGQTSTNDNGDGTYGIWFWWSSTTTTTQLRLYLNGQQITNSPYAITITPAAASGLTSTFEALTSGDDLTTYTAGQSKSILVTLKDVYGNALGAVTGQTQLTASFASSSNTLTAVTYSPASPYKYQINLVSSIASSTSLLVRLGSTDIVNSPLSVTVNPGVVNGTNSLISSPDTGLTTPTAGETSTIWLTPRDRYGNYITQSNLVNTFSVSPSTGVSYTGPTWQAPVGATPGYYVWTWTPTIKGTYSISAAFAGVSLASLNQYQPYVSPSVVNASTSNVTFDAGTYFVADATASATIQARDRFGNNRDGANSGTNFFVGLQIGTAVINRIECGTAAVSGPVGGSNALTCNFDAAGRYLITWKGQTAGTYNVSVTYGNAPVGGKWYSTYIDAGAASAVKTILNTVNGGVAGAQLSFTMTTYDGYGNLRGATSSTSDDSSLFDVVITTSPAAAVTLVSITKQALTGIYTQVWTATQAGAYKIEVKLLGAYISGGSNGGTVTNVMITPAAINNTQTTISGGGLVGGIESTNATIAITPRDQYGNQLATGALASLITCNTYAVTATPTNPTVHLTATTTTSSSGTFAAFTGYYLVPVYGTNTKTYGFKCVITSNNAVIIDTQATVVSSSDINRGKIVSGIFANHGSGTITSATQYSFIIQNQDISGNCDGTPVTYNAIFTHSTGAQSPVQVTQSTAVGGCNYTINYALATAGVYTLTIRTSLAVETEESKAGYGTVTVISGGLSAAKSKISGIPITVTAGSTGNSYIATLYDVSGNKFTSANGIVAANFAVTYSGTTAGPGCTTGTITDNGDGSFTIPYVCNLIGTTQVTTTVSGGTGLGGTTYGITVIPQPPSPAKSTLTIPIGYTYTAGVEGSLTFNAYDQYNNAVSGLKSGVYGPVNITLAGDANIGTSFDYTKTGSSTSEYTVKFTPSVALQYQSGAQTVTVFVNGIAVAYVNIIIRPGAFSASQSSLSFPTSTPSFTYTAGTPFTVILTARDSYGNYWFNTTDRLSVTSSSGSVTVSQGSGASTFSLQVTATTAGSAYQLLVGAVNTLGASASSITGLTGNVGWSIVAGAASAPQTVLTDGSTVRLPGSVFAAGTGFDVNLRLRDQYGNAIYKGGETVRYGIVQSQLYDSSNPISAQTIKCLSGNIAVDWQYNYTQHFFDSSSKIYDNGDGTYRLFIRGTKASATSPANGYGLVIFVNGPPTVTLCSAMTMLFTITPLGADPASSLVDGTALVPSLAKVGVDLTIRVTMRDIYGNDVNVGGNVTVGASPKTGTPSCMSSPNLLVLNTTSEPFAAVNGIARIQLATFVRSEAKTYYLVVTVDGTSVPAYECTTITLTAGYAYSFTATPGTTYAAIPATFDISATDVYGNAVVNGTHYYTVQFQRTDDAIYPISGYVASGTDANRYPTFAYHTISYLLAWQGSYVVSITLRDTDSASPRYTSGFQRLASLTVSAATCVADTPNKPFRCPAPSYSCVAQASDCSGYDTTCSVNALTRCNTTSCGATASSCGCPSGYVQCTGGGGHCVTNAAECPAAWNEGVCASGYVKCTTGAGAGECRQSLDECPSSVVCASGYVACPDKRTCAATAAACPSLGATSCPSSTPYLCRSGLCAINGESCGTGTSCGAGMYLCADGTCTTTPNLCSQQYLCYAPTATRCPDGSCRSSLADCPSTIVCPINWVRCPNNNCAATLSACSAAESCNWNSTLVRCPDGSCKTNLMFCGTSVTCSAAAPILCGDRSCVTDGSLCLRPPTCSDSTAPYSCPDGSCAASLAACPTTITCPSTSPVLCPDLTCASSVASCTQLVPACPATLPIKCVVDGSCRARAIDCPTATQCDDSTPVRCPDGKCAIAIDACVSISLLICPTGSVRCPSGECAPSLNLCPTHVTCLSGTTRCSDGTCRSSCASALTDYLYVCGAGRVICPQATQGTICADSLEQCPSSMVCPPRTPVRCADQTCAATVDECQPVTAFSSSKKACPGGFWAAKDQSCGTPVTCPKNLPSKCWDESCRALPSDCPPIPKCPSTAPFVCPNGECQDNLFSCTAGAKCADAKPVKCFAYPTGQTTGCVVNRDQCVNTTDASITLVSKCPDNRQRCRNGACAPDSYSCPAMSCPFHLPYLCTDGLCAKDVTQCNSATNGCPYDRPYKCVATGECKATEASCPSTPSTCSKTGRPVYCSDGSCAATINDCPKLATGCDTNAIRCIDGGCYDDVTKCKGSLDDANTCPISRPFRCADGFCAISSYLCPILPHYLTAYNTSDSSVQPDATYTCGITSTGVLLPVRCADGTCRASYDACPIVKACATGYVRCGNGQCATTADACPDVNYCPTIRPYKCLNGLCAVSAAQCIDDTIGCPATQVKCTNGQCAASGTCGTPALGSGCASGQVKCNNGACVASLSSCPASNGCPSGTPFLCSDGTCSASRCTTTSFDCPTGQVRCASGLCAASYDACTLANGCNVQTPYRCADGTCKKYQAVDPTLVTLSSSDACQPIVTCPSNLPYLCANNECVTESKYCRPLHQCTTGTLCRDGICRDVCDATTQARCPAAAPTLCPSGACKKTVAECESQTAQLSSRNPCTSPNVLCADGTCAAGWLACGAKTYRSYNPTGTWTNNMAQGSNVSCPISLNGEICADGTCAPHRSLCPPVPACPTAYPWRCPDGSCTNNGTAGATTCASVDACAAGTQRCEDGYCRTTCLAVYGCPLSAPFYCAGKKSPCVASYTYCASVINAPGVNRRLLNLVTTQDPPEACGSDCLKNIPAIKQTVTIPYNEEVTLDIAVDTTGISRTSIVIPSGAFGGTQALTISPVGTYGLDRPNQALKFYFAQRVLSTPWSCSRSTTGEFALNVTVQSSIDTRLYNLAAGEDGGSATTDPLAVPCELVSSYLASRVQPQSTVNATVRCTGVTQLTTDQLSYECEGNSVQGVIQTRDRYVRWGDTSNTKSVSCLCFNVTGGNQFALQSLACYGFQRLGDIVTALIIKDAPTVCPTQAQIEEAAIRVNLVNETYQSSSLLRYSGVDQCGTTSTSTIQLIPSDDICLGTIDPVTNEWRCLEGRNERIAYPTWDTNTGRPRSRVVGRINSCDYQVYAFVHIPMPPEPLPPTEPFDWWAKWRAVILGVGISVVVCGIVSAYAISRLIRYRRKYREKKKQLDQLTERAQDLDEYAGGLGIADEEVDMVANPLVVEMQELEKQVKAINDDMAKEGEENQQIDELERERQRIFAEIEKIKEQLAKDREAAAAARVSIDKGPVSLNAGTGTTTTGGTTAPARPARTEQPKRHDFGDAKRPARKKNDE